MPKDAYEQAAMKVSVRKSCRSAAKEFPLQVSCESDEFRKQSKFVASLDPCDAPRRQLLMTMGLWKGM